MEIVNIVMGAFGIAATIFVIVMCVCMVKDTFYP